MTTSEEIDIVSHLSDNYREDLKLLREMDLTIVTEIDLDKLRILCAKYEIKDVVDKNTYATIIGKLSKEILSRLERLMIEDILEKYREEKQEKVPRKTQQAKTPPPAKW